MNHYETIFIIDPDTTDADREGIMEKVRSTFSQKNGELLLIDNWGVRKLAYEIEKKKQGRYVRLDYCGDGHLVDELERNFRLDYRVLKFMTILIDKDVDVDALKAAMAPAETKDADTSEETVSEKPAGDQPPASESAEITDETEPSADDAAPSETDTEEQS
jgi:small subunit ribosomal protein S6